MHGDPWTQEREQELRQWHEDGRSNREMAELTGRTEEAIEQHKHRLGLRSGSDTCQHCGLPLRKKNGRPANYCSQSCENWVRYEAEHGHRASVEIKGVCAYCGKEFARTVRPWGREGSGQSAYCSRDCDKAAWYRRKIAGPDGQKFLTERSERSLRRYYRRKEEARNG